MTLHKWLATASATIALSTAALSAQTKPNLAGTWDVNSEKTAAARAAAAPAAPAAGGAMRGGGGGVMSGGGGNLMSAGGAPMPYVIAHTPQSLTITRDLGDGSTQKWVYKLDGSESVNVNARTTLTTKSAFVGDKLITEGKQTTKTEQAEMAGTFKEVRWIDKDGSMHVETTRSINGGATTTSYLVLDKKK